MRARRGPRLVAGLALVMVGSACGSESSASGCGGPMLAATWSNSAAEESAQVGTTWYGDPARSGTVTLGQSGEPAFSPDGRRIAVGVGHGTGDGMAFSVVVVDVGTGHRRAVARPDSNSVAPAWSRDGRRLAYIGGVWPESQVRVVGTDGRDDRAVASIRDEDRTLLSPAWSPDGRTVYFLNVDSRAFGGGTAVWSVSATGGPLRRMANVHPGVDRMVADRSGRRLLLSSGSDGPNQLLESGTGALHRLRGPAVMSATWAGASTILGYEQDRLVRFELDGSRLRRIGRVAGFHTRSIRRWYGVSARTCPA